MIKADYKGDKDAFAAFMKEIFRGSRIREGVFQGLASIFPDLGGMYRDVEKVKKVVGNSSETFDRYFAENMKSLLTWQVPNKYTVNYRDKELKHHSLGQRASALILFVLSQQENDVIIIDQPEDDLDNQDLQNEIINIMEGGEEAFHKRKEIYQLWNPRNF